MSEKNRESAGSSPENETEMERQRIIERLLELSHTVEGGSTINNIRNQEVKDLEKRLLEINPIQTNNPPSPETKERRVRQGSREAIQKLLKEIREDSENSTNQ